MTGIIQNLVSERKAKNNWTSLRFPQDIGPIGMMFKFKAYSYGGTGANSIGRGKTDSAVVLPLAQNLEDALGIKVGPADLGSYGAAAVEAIQSLQTNDLGTIYNNLRKGAETAGAQTADLVRSLSGGDIGEATGLGSKIKFFSRSAIDSLFPAAGLAVDVATGTAVNPHTTLNFDGVNLRQFTFNWQFAPKNEKESDTLRDIVKHFKSKILPSYGSLGVDGGSSTLSRAFLGYPDLIEIYLIGISEDHYLWFKPGMISNFVANYSPQGNVIVQGGKPAIVNLSMTFQEAKIHTREDYGGSSGKSMSLTTPKPLARGPSTRGGIRRRSAQQQSGPF